GDVYICPAAARRWVKNGGSGKGEEGRVEEELLRLTVHGALHVLGYDHPEGPGRTRSAMWRRQERYVRRLLGRGRGRGPQATRRSRSGAPSSPEPRRCGLACWRSARRPPWARRSIRWA